MSTPFVVENIIPASAELLSTGSHIVLFHAKRIPPHLLVVHHGKTWDLSVKGSRRAEPIETLLHYIERKKVVCLFIEWKTGTGSFTDILDTHFGRYEKIEAGKNSCLFPIRDVAAELHGKELSECEFIFQLLPALREKGALGKCHSLHLDSNSFEVLTYDQQQLVQSIREAETRKPEVSQ